MTLAIAAPPFFVQLFFRSSFESTGFSEGYWVQADDYSGALELVTDADGLVDKRRALFTTNGRIVYVRVSDATKTRDTKIKYITGTSSNGTYTPTTGDLLPAEAALLVRMEGVDDGAPVFTLKPLRLIPYEVAPDGAYNPPTAWTDAFAEYKEWLVTNAKIGLNINGTPTAVTIDDVLPTHMSHRKTGRPFGQPAGRSRLP